jgi:putative tryptophan/tyrosine transport system substrate-binding protein
MKRREFMMLVSAAAATWPHAVRAQQSERVKRIGVIMSVSADDPEGRLRIAAFLKDLQLLGWSDGRNVQTDVRWTAGPDDVRKYVAELAMLAPDIILTAGSATLGPLLQATRSVPIVRARSGPGRRRLRAEPGARPGGNATGFINFEYGISGKWLELLKEIAPGMKRAAVLRDPRAQQ